MKSIAREAWTDCNVSFIPLNLSKKSKSITDKTKSKNKERGLLFYFLKSVCTVHY